MDADDAVLEAVNNLAESASTGGYCWPWTQLMFLSHKKWVVACHPSHRNPERSFQLPHIPPRVQSVSTFPSCSHGSHSSHDTLVSCKFIEAYVKGWRPRTPTPISLPPSLNSQSFGHLVFYVCKTMARTSHSSWRTCSTRWGCGCISRRLSSIVLVWFGMIMWLFMLVLRAWQSIAKAVFRFDSSGQL